jgi:hypothetical protein
VAQLNALDVRFFPDAYVLLPVSAFDPFQAFMLATLLSR